MYGNKTKKIKEFLFIQEMTWHAFYMLKIFQIKIFNFNASF